MNRWLYLLILAAPAAVLAEALHASPLITFVLAALGLIPLAGLIGLLFTLPQSLEMMQCSGPT